MRAAQADVARPVVRRRAFNLTALFLLAAVLALAGAAVGRPGNVHGAVYSWAQAHPNRDIPLLVQTEGDP
ncbi:MAG TPA: hypothetical protein VFT91_02500, partial [Dehalococcoidia bacterium]|nr:hypothetical protein [Dehalococcoidia bacterium]